MRLCPVPIDSTTGSCVTDAAHGTHADGKGRTPMLPRAGPVCCFLPLAAYPRQHSVQFGSETQPHE